MDAVNSDLNKIDMVVETILRELIWNAMDKLPHPVTGAEASVLENSPNRSGEQYQYYETLRVFVCLGDLVAA